MKKPSLPKKDRGQLTQSANQSQTLPLEILQGYTRPRLQEQLTY